MPRARPDARSSLLPPSRRPRIARPVPQLSAEALDVLEAALDRLVPWKGGYAHGEGNAAAHVKASLITSGVSSLLSKAS